MSPILETERALLGAVMLAPDRFATLRPLVVAHDFHRPQHGRLWELLATLTDRGHEPDVVVVMGDIGARDAFEEYGGAGYVATLPSACASVDSAETYAMRVREASSRRILDRALQEARQALRDGRSIETAGAVVTAALAGAGDVSASTWRGNSQVVEQLGEDLLRRTQGLRGVSSGLQTLDARINGFCAPKLYVLAGRPGMGKSAVLGSIVRRCGLPAGVVTIEMAAAEWQERWACAEAGLDTERVSRAEWTPEERRRLMDALESLHGLPVWWEEAGSQTLASIQRAARRAVRDHGIQMLAIDHLQLVRSEDPRMSEVQALTLISGGLKQLAKELAIPIVLAAQLNRQCEARSDNRPQLSDLRGSGSIEQDADVVMFLYREEYYRPDDRDVTGLLEVDIAKHRGGRTGKVKLAVDMARMRITDLDTRHDDSQVYRSGYVGHPHWSDRGER